MRSERQALIHIAKFLEEYPGAQVRDMRREVRAILADVQPEPAPVEGVLLTREEAGTALDIVRAHLGYQGGRLSVRGRVKALAERLEAAS